MVRFCVTDLSARVAWVSQITDLSVQVAWVSQITDLSVRFGRFGSVRHRHKQQHAWTQTTTHTRLRHAQGSRRGQEGPEERVEQMEQVAAKEMERAAAEGATRATANAKEMVAAKDKNKNRSCWEQQNHEGGVAAK